MKNLLTRRTSMPGTALLLALMALWGCGGQNRKSELRLIPPDPQKLLVTAVRDADPDVRYRSLAEFSATKAIGEPWAVKGVETIVATDPNPLVRALGLHTLGRVADGRVLTQAIYSMNDSDPRVRAEAAWALAQVPYAEIEKAQMVAETREAMVRGLRDEALDVKIHSASGLGAFQDRDVVYALITALRDSNFSVRYHAEKSLIELTGKTFHSNPVAWLEWFDAASEPFANAGQTPPELVKPKQNVLEKSRDRIQQWYLNWQGPAKEQ
ncbi:MAG: HEAT repeat domain-containing protein [Phycisphaerae bacterium]|nr:HEAT repeat domain-containing protein [Phycisphaerae bacterium]